MQKKPEEKYLDSLYADDEETEAPPILLASQIIKQATSRPTYQELAASNSLITTLRPKPTVTVTNKLNQLTPSIDKDAHEVKLEVDEVIAAVEQRQAEHVRAVLEAEKARELAASVEQEIKGLQEEEAQLLLAQPRAPERLAKVQQWLAKRQAALPAQQAIVEAAEATAAGTEADLRAVEAELDFLADLRQDLDATFTADEAGRREVAAALHAREERVAAGYLACLERQVARLEELQSEQAAAREACIQAAEEAQERARERLHQGLQRVRRNLERGRQVVAAQNAARRQAVLGLKDSLAQVRSEVAHKAALYRQLQKQKREVQDREFQDLIEQGLNPYEIYRRRDQKAQVARQRADIRRRIEQRQVEVAAQLAREAEQHQQKLKQQERQRQEALAFQREVGREAQVARTEAYMKAHTIGGQLMLDPTGRMPVDPSAAVLAKTHDFGSGRAPQALLDKLSAKHHSVTPNKLLIPSKYRDQSEGDFGSEDDELDSDAGYDLPRGAMTERSGFTSFTQAFTNFSQDGKEQATTKAGGGKGWKQLEQRPLTKFERSAMDSAKARHKTRIAAPKTMMGKEFGGDAFMTTPAVVQFLDFEVGSTLTAQVAITNRSYSKNTYRVVEVPPEYGNVLEVSYDLPGYLATGVSGHLTITFTPKANEDISTHVNMLAETGPFQIPIKCVTKKAVLAVSSPSVDFGPGVVLGEQATRTFNITNQGALEVEYRLDVEGQDPAASSLSPDGRALLCPPFSISPASGTVPGYGQVAVQAVFTPSRAEGVRMALQVTYKAVTQRKLFIPQDSVSLVGIGRDVPIFLERSLIDFKCVMVDHIYRDKLIVRNGGKTALKVSVANRADVSDYFEFAPDFGFVQAGESFPITVMFKPKASTLKQCQRYLTAPNSGVLQIPMKVTVPDQKLPVAFTLRAHVTTTDLVFMPPSLDFGPCVMAEDTGVVLRVTNPSALPQTFAFVNLPMGIHIMPNDGFGYILPGETVERIVAFQPPIPGPQRLTITACTLAGRTFTLPCTAHGVQPSLSLSHNKISFPATPLNDVTTLSVTLHNNSSTSQAFEFGVPPASGLVFIPHMGLVPPSGSMRVQIDFAPLPEGNEPGEYPEPKTAAPAEDPEAAAAAAAAVPPTPASKTSKSSASPTAKPAAQTRDITSPGAAPPTTAPPAPPPIAEGVEEEGVEEFEDAVDGPDLNTWYRWQQFSVPCFIRPSARRSQAEASRGERRSSSSGVSALEPPTPGLHSRPMSAASSWGTDLGAGQGMSPGQVQPQALHLDLVTCAVSPDIVLRSDLPWYQEKRCYELDFGPVPVGQRITRTIHIFNQSAATAQLASEPLDHRGIFSVVNTWRALAPSGRWRSLLSFTPQHRSAYLQILTIYTPRTRIRIALKGQGIAPELRLQPEDITSQGLDLGDVLKGESSEARFSVTNVCPFPLSFAMRFRGVREPNLTNRPAFYCRPAEGTLVQGESCEVVVVFKPCSQRPYYEDELQVYVPNQQEQMLVPLKGRGWEEGIFISGPTYPRPLDDPFMETQLAALATAALAQQAGPQQVPATAKPGASKAPAGKAGAEAAAGRPGTPSKTGEQQVDNPLLAGLPPGATGPLTIGPPGSPSPIFTPPPLGVVAMAPAHPKERTLVLTLPQPLFLGETSTSVLEVGSLRSTAFNAAPGEVVLDELPAAAQAAGWSVATGRLALAAGEKKAISVRFSAPYEPHAGMAAALGFAESMELRLTATLKGGAPAPATAEGRRVVVVCRVQLMPRQRIFNDKIAAGITEALTAAERAAALEASPQKGKKKVGL